MFHIPLVFNLHDPLVRLQIFAKNFNTNCPSPWVVQKYCQKGQPYEQGARTLQTKVGRLMP